MMKLVSIIIPVYNTANYLHRCFDSILNQSYENIEIILVDDGSTDDSLKICSEYESRDHRIHIYHIENSGVSAARNYGISKASGDYLIFVDSDDWLELDAVETMLFNIQEKNADIGITSFLFEYENETKRIEISDTPSTTIELFSDINDIENTNFLISSPCNKIYKTETIKDNCLEFRTELKFGEDFTFNTQYLLSVNTVAVKNTPLYHYDCSREGSGVKRLYEDFDVYIITMQQELKKLLSSLSVQNPDGVLHALIDPRWEYAINVCLSTPISNKEKASVLTRWLSKLSPNDIERYSQGKHTLAFFCRHIQKRSLIEEKYMESLIKKYKKVVQNKNFILKIKRTIRGII